MSAAELQERLRGNPAFQSFYYTIILALFFFPHSVNYVRQKSSPGLTDPKVQSLVQAFPDQLLWCREDGMIASKSEPNPFVRLRVFGVFFSQLPMTVAEFKKRSSKDLKG